MPKPVMLVLLANIPDSSVIRNICKMSNITRKIETCQNIENLVELDHKLHVRIMPSCGNKALKRAWESLQPYAMILDGKDRAAKTCMFLQVVIRMLKPTNRK